MYMLPNTYTTTTTIKKKKKQQRNNKKKKKLCLSQTFLGVKMFNLFKQISLASLTNPETGLNYNGGECNNIPLSLLTLSKPRLT